MCDASNQGEITSASPRGTADGRGVRPPTAERHARVRSNAELRRLLALPGATAVESLLHLQRSAGNSAASGLIRLLLSGKGPAATSEVEGGLALHGSITASYNGGRWRIKHERATPTDGCDCPPPTRCLHLTGDLVSTYAVTVRISMPDVPAGLTRCQQRRVREFLRNVLRPHEEDHARRFRTYNGRTVRPDRPFHSRGRSRLRVIQPAVGR